MLAFSDKIRRDAEFALLAAVPLFSKESCELDSIIAKGSQVSVHLADTVYEIGFCRHCAATVATIKRIPLWQTDTEHVVKVPSVVMFFPKIRAHILREVFNNTEHGP